jgi:hypothetical protein
MKKLNSIKAGVTMTALDLRNNSNFDGIGDVRHYVGRTSRSASEAFKDADYATGLWKCESDFMYGVRFIRGMLEGMTIVIGIVVVPVLLVLWVTK